MVGVSHSPSSSNSPSPSLSLLLTRLDLVDRVRFLGRGDMSSLLLLVDGDKTLAFPPARPRFFRALLDRITLQEALSTSKVPLVVWIRTVNGMGRAHGVCEVVVATFEEGVGCMDDAGWRWYAIRTNWNTC